MKLFIVNRPNKWIKHQLQSYPANELKLRQVKINGKTNPVVV
jgi:hypothetical protein